MPGWHAEQATCNIPPPYHNKFLLPPSTSPDAREDSTTAVTPMDLDDLGTSSPTDLDGPDPVTPTAPGSKGKRHKSNRKGHQARRKNKKRRKLEGPKESS